METKIVRANAICVSQWGYSPITVEVQEMDGIGIHLVGYPDEIAREVLLRVVTALQSWGIRLPGNKIVINLGCKYRYGVRWELFDLAVFMCLAALAGEDHIDDEAYYLGQLDLEGYLQDCGEIETGAIKKAIGHGYLVCPMGTFPKAMMIDGAHDLWHHQRQ